MANDEVTADNIQVTLKDGRLETACYFIPEPKNEKFFEVVQSCIDGDIDGVAILFDIEKAATDLIEWYACNDGSMDADGKPVFDAMRTKLEAALAKINSVKFN